MVATAVDTQESSCRATPSTHAALLRRANGAGGLQYALARCALDFGEVRRQVMLAQFVFIRPHGCQRAPVAMRRRPVGRGRSLLLVEVVEDVGGDGLNPGFCVVDAVEVVVGDVEDDVARTQDDASVELAGRDS